MHREPRCLKPDGHREAECLSFEVKIGGCRTELTPVELSTDTLLKKKEEQVQAKPQLQKKRGEDTLAVSSVRQSSGFSLLPSKVCIL